MRLITLPLKNALVSWWRSLTLGTFIFILCFSLIFFQSITQTATLSMQSAVTDNITGHIQVRPGSTTETDMADIMKTSWQALPIFSGQETKNITAKLASALPGAEIIPRIRANVLLVSDKDKIPSMLQALDPDAKTYRKGFPLIEGHYIEKPNEIILTEKDAKKLSVKIGDSIGILATTSEGYSVDGAFTVVGIGNLRMLEMFGMSVSFAGRQGLAEVLGIDKDSATEILAVLKDYKTAPAAKTAMEKILSGTEYKITDYQSMGGFVLGIASGTGIFFYGMLVILMAVMAILIANLVFLTCLERFKEIATFRALGFSRFQVAGLFVAEIVIISAVFGGLGILAGILLILYFGQAGFPALSRAWEYSMGKNLYLTVQPDYILTVIIIAGLFIAGASLFPSLKAVKAKPAEALRED